MRLFWHNVLPFIIYSYHLFFLMNTNFRFIHSNSIALSKSNFYVSCTSLSPPLMKDSQTVDFKLENWLTLIFKRLSQMQPEHLEFSLSSLYNLFCKKYYWAPPQILQLYSEVKMIEFKKHINGFINYSPYNKKISDKTISAYWID